MEKEAVNGIEPIWDFSEQGTPEWLAARELTGEEQG